MPPKKRGKSETPSRGPTSGSGNGSEGSENPATPAAPLTTDISDPLAIKATLDDELTKYLTEVKQIDEDHTITDAKILIGVLSIIVALYAQFGSIPFPSGRWTLGALVVLYMVLQTGLTYIQGWVQGDAIFIAKRSGDNSPKLTVQTLLPRFDTTYTVTVVVSRTAG